MKNFILVYKGGKMEMDPEESKRVMAVWGKWYDGLGSYLAHGGFAFIPMTAKMIVDGNVSMCELGLSGYTMIQAKDMDEAVKLSMDCPVKEGSGEVHVYEEMKMEGM